MLKNNYRVQLDRWNEVYKMNKKQHNACSCWAVDDTINIYIAQKTNLMTNV